jgi:peptidoglycan/LPS O-acetylase OafA/YrhL
MTNFQKDVENRYYRPELDVLRFLVLNATYSYQKLPCTEHFPHIAHSLNGPATVTDGAKAALEFGLSLFFTQSAFIIFELLLRKRGVAETVGVNQFHIRRVLRIWPLYCFSLFLGVAVAFLSGGHSADISRISWFVIVMGAWDITMHGLVQSPMNPQWSISVEGRFYLFSPWRIKYCNRKSPYCVSTVIILLANVTLYHLGRVEAPSNAIWFNPVMQFEFSAAGILLCFILRAHPLQLAIWRRIMLVTAAGLFWFLRQLWDSFAFQQRKRKSRPLAIGQRIHFGCTGMRFPHCCIYRCRSKIPLRAGDLLGANVVRALRISWLCNLHHTPSHNSALDQDCNSPRFLEDWSGCWA